MQFHNHDERARVSPNADQKAHSRNKDHQLPPIHVRESFHRQFALIRFLQNLCRRHGLPPCMPQEKDVDVRADHGNNAVPMQCACYVAYRPACLLVHGEQLRMHDIVRRECRGQKARDGLLAVPNHSRKRQAAQLKQQHAPCGLPLLV